MTYFSAPPPKPSRAEPNTFAPKAEDLMGHLDVFADEGNVFAGDMNTLYDDACAARNAAVIAASYAGVWGTLSGTIDKPAMVWHEDNFWALLNNLADVQASEPGVSADWAVVAIGIPPGGTAGQVLRKQSGDDYDVGWVEVATLLNHALETNQTFAGDISVEIVGESVAFGDALYFDWGTKKYKKADRTDATKMPCVVLALQSKADGEACELLRRGWARDDSLGLDGSLVYVSTAGGITSLPSLVSGMQVQRIGQAISPTVIWFAPSMTVVEVA